MSSKQSDQHLDVESPESLHVPSVEDLIEPSRPRRSYGAGLHRDMTIKNGDFKNCVLENCGIHKGNLHGCILINCVLIESNMLKCVAKNSVIHGEPEIRSCKLKMCAMTGKAKILGTIMEMCQS